jgi:hypothetical protein
MVSGAVDALVDFEVAPALRVQSDDLLVVNPLQLLNETQLLTLGGLCVGEGSGGRADGRTCRLSTSASDSGTGCRS